MRKRIYLILLGIVSLFGIGAMVYFGIQPRPVLKIKLSKFDSSMVLANSVLLRLRQEIRQSPVLILGVQPNKPDQIKVWRDFLNNDVEAGSKYDVIYKDSSVVTDLFPEAKSLDFKEEFQTLLSEIQNGVFENKRIALLAPTTYASQTIPQSMGYFINQNLQKKALSFSLVDFPRSREEEKVYEFPCVVEGVDQSGLGPFGCLLLQSARAQYRKRFQPGESIGFLNQIGMFDYIVFYTREK